jgi:hypothetical protein
MAVKAVTINAKAATPTAKLTGLKASRPVVRPSNRPGQAIRGGEGRREFRRPRDPASPTEEPEKPDARPAFGV